MAESAGAGAPLAARVRAEGAVLLEALERHAPGSRVHAGATGTFAFLAALGSGLERGRAELIREAAKLHAVGKLYAPGHLLARPSAELTPAEREQVSGHEEQGAALVRGAGIDDRVAEWVLRARERFDGSGPEGLGGEEIPLESRIIRAACQAARLAAAGGDAGALRAAGGSELDPALAERLASQLAGA